MLKITLATSNKHKVDEINLIARDFDIEFVLPEGNFDPIEDGSDFLENAYCKAKFASENGKTKYFLADDSGLCVDALNGAPGIYSARYAPNPKARINKLLDAMKDKNDRRAKFVCAMVVVNQNGEILFKTQGECKGSILHQERGEGGFGYDPVFLVEGLNCSMAELTKEEKSRVSHRSIALNEVLNWFRNEILK